MESVLPGCCGELKQITQDTHSFVRVLKVQPEKNSKEMSSIYKLTGELTLESKQN